MMSNSSAYQALKYFVYKMPNVYSNPNWGPRLNIGSYSFRYINNCFVIEKYVDGKDLGFARKYAEDTTWDEAYNYIRANKVALLVDPNYFVRDAIKLLMSVEDDVVLLTKNK